MMRLVSATFLFTLFVQSVFAIPITITLSGFLTEADGTPTSGTFAGRVSFYSTESDAVEIAFVDIDVTVEDGVLSSFVILPGEILLMDEVWYAFAVDSENDGIDSADYFQDRFQLTSVPFSLTGKPVTFFETHNGMSAAPTGAKSFPYPAYTAIIVPFTTPPGGVEFNRISSRIWLQANANCSIMFGIYDSNGVLLYSSPVIRGTAIEQWQYHFEVQGRLQPSTIYYSALWSNNWSQFNIPENASAPSVPTSGVLFNAGTVTGLKRQIDLSLVDPDREYRAVSIGLYTIDESSPAAMRRTQGLGVAYEHE